jgi:hypothetical protein
MALKNAVGDRITTYCIFDSDYHTTQEKAERYRQAGERGINLHIWERKEIENYLLDPVVIARVIKQRTKTTAPTVAVVSEFLLQTCENEKDNVFDAMATHQGQQDHKLGAGTANKAARALLDNRWKHGPLHVVPGKELLARLSAWAQENYGVAIGAMALARALRITEIPQEMTKIISSIEEGTAFPNH